MYANGNLFEGNWKNDMMNGEGKYVMKNGSYYKGFFVNNLFLLDQAFFLFLLIFGFWSTWILGYLPT